MNEEELAQISARDDMLFRAFLVPVGLLIAWIGLHAVRTRRLHLRKWHDPITGKWAVILGGVITLLGVLFTAAALYTFIRK